MPNVEDEKCGFNYKGEVLQVLEKRNVAVWDPG
jgi:hypothetical protein